MCEVAPGALLRLERSAAIMAAAGSLAQKAKDGFESHLKAAAAAAWKAALRQSHISARQLASLA